MSVSAPQSRARWLILCLALATMLFVVLASACSGDDNESSDNNATATKEAGGESSSTSKATPTKEASNGGGNSDAAKELKNFASEYQKFEGYVKYEAKDFGGTDSSLTAMAIYQKGDKSRIDIESSEGNVILITTADASYMCSQDQCLKYPAGDTTGAGAVEGFTSILDPSTIESDFGELPEGVDVNVSKEKIAGIDATCFSASGDLNADTPGDESGEICFAEGGLMLRLKFEGGGESGTLEATDARSSLSDSDFEPPYTVIDFSSAGQ